VKLGKKGAVAPLIKALNDPDPDVRWKAAWALGEINDARAVGPLLDALRDGDGLVRNSASISLSLIFESLAKRLGSEDFLIRGGAGMTTLGALDPLIGALVVDNVTVRGNAVGVFVTILEPLLNVLTEVDDNAADALIRKIMGPLVKALKYENRRGRLEDTNALKFVSNERIMARWSRP